MPLILFSEQSKFCSEHNDSVSLESELLSWRSIQESSEITEDLIKLQYYNTKKIEDFK